MREIDRLQFEIHAKSTAFRYKLEEARAIVDSAIALNVSGYVAFSGGLDSTVVLDLVLKVKPDFNVFWIDDGADYRETLQFVEETAIQRKCRIQYIRGVKAWGQWCREMGRPDLVGPGEAMDAAWINPISHWDEQWLSDTQYPRMLYERGLGLCFTGMMASESKNRNLVLEKGYRPLYQRGKFGEWSCCPLAKWQKRDVWAYIVSHHLPYNNVYNKLAELDIPLQHRRVGPLTCFRIMHYGTHGHVLKHVDYELYNRLSNVFPKIREYS